MPVLEVLLIEAVLQDLFRDLLEDVRPGVHLEPLLQDGGQLLEAQVGEGPLDQKPQDPHHVGPLGHWAPLSFLKTFLRGSNGMSQKQCRATQAKGSWSVPVLLTTTPAGGGGLPEDLFAVATRVRRGEATSTGATKKSSQSRTVPQDTKGPSPGCDANSQNSSLPTLTGLKAQASNTTPPQGPRDNRAVPEPLLL